MKKNIIAVLALILTTLSFADYDFDTEDHRERGNENTFELGAGVVAGKHLYKGGKGEIFPLPLLDIKYNDFYAKGYIVGYKFYQNDLFATSLFVDAFSGYPIKSKNIGSGYKNIDNRHFQTMFGVRMDGDTGIFDVRAGVSAQIGEHGSSAKIEMSRPYYASDRLVLIPLINATTYSSSYTDYYFGVTQDEVNRSKTDKLNRVYDPSRGYSIGIKLIADYALTDSLSMMAFIGMDRFSNEISDSPIVENTGILYLIGAGAKYRF